MREVSRLYLPCRNPFAERRFGRFREVSPEIGKILPYLVELIFIQSDLHILATTNFLLAGYSDFAGRPKKNCSLVREKIFPS